MVTQGNGRGRIVVDDRDRQSYLERFRLEAAERDWAIHASSLLDTHHHVVLTTAEPDLGVGMGRVIGGHAAWFNARHERQGAVFAERFWSRRADVHVVRASVYSLVNPVAAGLVDHPRSWPWSSYREIQERGCTPLLEELIGDALSLLELVDEAVARIHAGRLADGRAVWSLVGSVVDETGRG